MYCNRGLQALPDIGERGVAEAMAEWEYGHASIELVCASGRVPHAHVEEGELVHIVCRILHWGENYRCYMCFIEES